MAMETQQGRGEVWSQREGQRRSGAINHTFKARIEGGKGRSAVVRGRFRPAHEMQHRWKDMRAGSKRRRQPSRPSRKPPQSRQAVVTLHASRFGKGRITCELGCFGRPKFLRLFISFAAAFFFLLFFINFFFFSHTAFCCYSNPILWS